MNTEKYAVSKLAAAIRAMDVNTNQDIIDVAETAGLIGKAMSAHNPDGRFFQKSFGPKAGKAHLKNYAPNYQLEHFLTIGCEYHEFKNWGMYSNELSYALLGMAVLTGREPSMSKGIYTACGKSFGKHPNTNWGKWLDGNVLAIETTRGPLQVLEEEVVVQPSQEQLELPAPPALIELDMSQLPPVDVLAPQDVIESTATVIIEEQLSLEVDAPEVVEFVNPVDKKSSKKAAGTRKPTAKKNVA